MQTDTETTKVTVAYRVPGGTWKRKTFTEGSAAEDRFYDWAEDEAAEVRWQD